MVYAQPRVACVVERFRVTLARRRRETVSTRQQSLFERVERETHASTTVRVEVMGRAGGQEGARNTDVQPRRSGLKLWVGLWVRMERET